jgi:hypothetical protein
MHQLQWFELNQGDSSMRSPAKMPVTAPAFVEGAGSSERRVIAEQKTLAVNVVVPGIDQDASQQRQAVERGIGWLPSSTRMVARPVTMVVGGQGMVRFAMIRPANTDVKSRQTGSSMFPGPGNRCTSTD